MLCCSKNVRDLSAYQSAVRPSFSVASSSMGSSNATAVHLLCILHSYYIYASAL